MKQLKLFCCCLGLLAVLTGCSVSARMDAVEDRIEDKLEQEFAAPASETSITAEEAAEIALTHAGFTAEDVRGLHTEYEWDDGVPEYEVDFYHDRWEYDYTIHAETGNILAFEKDD